MAILTMTRRTDFQCAHSLPQMPSGHKCRRTHGHTYTVEVTCEGEVGSDGLIFDNAEIDALLRGWRVFLDHTHLNEINGLGFPSDNPTAENILLWMAKDAKRKRVGNFVTHIVLHEGPRSTFSIELGND